MNSGMNRFGKQRSSEGFSLIEMMIAVGVLGIAMIGGLAMVVVGVGRNTSMRMDTTSANVAQTVLEDIAAAPPDANPTLTITDCVGNALTINTTPGGAALEPDPPTSKGVNPGDIDFKAGKVAGYWTTYAMCAPNGARPAPYEVRWNIQTVGTDSKGNSWGKLVTVAARQTLAVSDGKIYYSPPVTLRTVVGM